MNNTENIQKIKQLVKEECFNLGHVDFWFYKTHLLMVEKFAKFILEKKPEANSEIVLLGVWLHDMGRVRGINGDHQQAGAIEAEKVMRQFEYSEDIITKVKNIILSHSCEEVMPDSLEGQILATADAMSHYTNDFYLQIAVTGKRNLQEFKKWALEKIDRDFNKKIAFDFAKDEIHSQHEVLKNLLTKL
jgi:hypothetical protein